jgi:glycosyltransferase involved in cell wall biosynthesis
MSLRILFVNRMASLVRGGGETFDLEMARHLAELGCRITFLSGIPLSGRARLGPKDWWPDGEVRNSKFEIRNSCIRTPNLTWFPWDKVRGGWRVRWADFVLFERAAARWAWARRDQFDVVQVCELVNFVHRWQLLSSGRHIPPTPPVSMRLTAPDFYDPHGALRRADLVIASGTTMRKMQAGPRPDCVNIPNGVDVNLFRPHASDFRARQGWGDDEQVVLFVARFQAVKNHAMLVDAFRRVAAEEPRARLVLAGSGPLEGDVRARCAAAGLAARVTFLGEMPFDRVADLYAAADVNVISSDYESFSFVALEGMASGLPLVATATEWVPTLIGGEPARACDCPGGLVVPVGDAGAFAAAVLRLLRDAARRKELGAWNRRRVERDFGWAASARRLLEVYQERVAAPRQN